LAERGDTHGERRQRASKITKTNDAHGIIAAGGGAGVVYLDLPKRDGPALPTHAAAALGESSPRGSE